jgi:molybdate transport system permease protein
LSPIHLEEAYRIYKNLLVLSAGKMAAYGHKENIFERPATFISAQLSECKNFSLARTVPPHLLEALDWGCTLYVIEPIPDELAYMGIRPHHFTFPEKSGSRNNSKSKLRLGDRQFSSQNPKSENIFPGWG